MKGSKDHNDNYTLKDILRYLKGDKKGREANKFERHLEEDPFLRDALEGYEEFAAEEGLEKELSEIEKYVAYRRSQESGGNSGRRILAIAASLTILISASLWLWFGMFEGTGDSGLADLPQTEEKMAKKLPADSGEMIDFEEQAISETEEADIPEKVDEKSEIAEESIALNEVTAEPETQAGAKAMNEDATSGFAMLSAASEAPSPNTDSLIARILRAEKDFWLAQSESAVAANFEEPVPGQAAPALKEESAEPLRKKSRSMEKAAEPAPAVAMDAMLSDESTEKELPSALVLIDSLEDQKPLFFGSESLDEDYNLVMAISSLYKKDTSAALIYLEKVNARNENQKVAIDSLIMLLSR